MTEQRNRSDNSSARLTGVLSAKARSAAVLGRWVAQTKTNAVTIKSEKKKIGSSNMFGGFTFSAGGRFDMGGSNNLPAIYTLLHLPEQFDRETSQLTEPFVPGFRKRPSRQLEPSNSWSHPWST